MGLEQNSWQEKLKTVAAMVIDEKGIPDGIAAA